MSKMSTTYLCQMFVLTIGLSFSAPALSISLIVQDPCSGSLWLESDSEAIHGTSVGAITIAQLEDFALPYNGSEQGISSINATVTGNDSLEVISQSEMRSYGWCFKLNGVEPNLYPHQVFVQNEHDSIYWFFGFAHYKDGGWISFCTPTHKSKPSFICTLPK